MNPINTFIFISDSKLIIDNLKESKDIKYKKLSFDDVKNYVLEKYINTNQENTYSSLY
jgi:hypothetical protein